MASTLQPVLVVAGVGNGAGTGASAARVFAKAGYSIALIGRREDKLKQLSAELEKSGAKAHPFPVSSYEPEVITSAFSAIDAHFPPNTHSIRAAVFNAGDAVLKPFLDITFNEFKQGIDSSIGAGWSFARESILRFQKNDLGAGSAAEGKGKRGTLIFTGATASIRGNVTTSSFSSGKHALRALSQSLAKEFGKQNIHVAHAIIDGGILTDRSAARGEEFAADTNRRLGPESIAQSYLYLASQDNSAFTWELDLRPAHEKW